MRKAEETGNGTPGETLTAPAGGGTTIERVLDMIPAGAYICDPEGLITYFNEHARAIWGRAPKLNDPVDRFCGSFKLYSPFGPAIRHDQCWMALALRTRREYNGHEIIIERPDGSRATVLAHANPLFDGDGKVTGAVNVLVDISDRKRMEDSLRDADRYKDEFLATLAHELRNPMTPIRNAVHILRLTGAQGPARDRVLDTLDRQIQHMVRLIDDLLEVSRIARGKLELRKERVELSTVIETALETARAAVEGAGLHLSVTVPPEPVVIEADPTRIAQVLTNLLNNAAKFTEPGGTIQLTVERDGNEAVLRVRDNGIGIPPEVLPRIFDMFTQLRSTSRNGQQGLGIGLTVVKSVVEMHGGTVSAQSAGPGQGSEFSVRLPIVTSRAGARADKTAENGGGAKALSRRRILIVDDNRDGAESLAMLLNFMGSDVRVAYNGPSALETMAAYRPDVVLLDIGMPGMDGYEVAGRVRRDPELQHLTLIALTGWGQEEDRRRCRQVGFDHHLIKPLDLDALQTLLTSLPHRDSR